MTTNFNKIISQCDEIDLLDDATIFSISGTKSQALAQQKEIENTLKVVNCSITYIEDDSTGFEEDSASYSIHTNLPLIEFNQLSSSPELFNKEKIMRNIKLSQSQILANETVEAIIEDPLAYLIEQDAILDTFKGKKIITYHREEKHLSITCDEEGNFMVGVNDKKDMLVATGFSEKLSIITDILYEEQFS
jgi:hypothetical protein